LRFVHDKSNCPHCNVASDELKQNRPILIRDLSVFGKVVYLDTPRRQFYCHQCQKYFTEMLPFADWERRYTQRYEEYVYQRVQNTSKKLKDNLIAKGERFRDGYQGHHVIPPSVADKSDLMLNAVEKAGFDIDCAENGIFLPDNILGDELLPSHRGNHPRYSNIAEDILKHKWDELKKYGVQDDKLALLSAINDTVKYLREVIETQGRQLRFKVNDV